MASNRGKLGHDIPEPRRSRPEPAPIPVEPEEEEEEEDDDDGLQNLDAAPSTWEEEGAPQEEEEEEEARGAVFSGRGRGVLYHCCKTSSPCCHSPNLSPGMVVLELTLLHPPSPPLGSNIQGLHPLG